MGPEDIGGEDESELEDDGLSSEDEGESEDEFFDAQGEAPSAFPPTAPSASAIGSDSTPLPAIVASPLPTDLAPAVRDSSPKRPNRLPRLFSSRSSKQSKESGSSSTGSTPLLSGTSTPGGTVSGTGDYLSAKAAKESSSRSGSLTPGGTRIRRPKFKKRARPGYALDVSQDIQGIVMLEIVRAEDLPKVRASK